MSSNNIYSSTSPTYSNDFKASNTYSNIAMDNEDNLCTNGNGNNNSRSSYNIAQRPRMPPPQPPTLGANENQPVVTINGINVNSH